MPDLRIVIILGSTRPGRKATADWITDAAVVLFDQLESWSEAMETVRARAHLSAERVAAAR